MIESRSKKDTERRTNTIKTIGLLIVVVIITYTPFLTITLIRSYYVYYKQLYPGNTIDKLAAFSIYPVHLFGITNAVIYGLGNKEVKRYVTGIFGRSRNSVLSTDNQ